MAWNTPSQGVLPANTGVVFHAGNVPQIRNAGQDWANAGQAAIQAIGGILQQRRNDAIANQLLAADQKQTQSQDAYDPTGAVAGGDQTSALVNPPTQDNSFLHRAMVSLGLSSNAPDLGGVDALKVHDQIQKQLQDTEDRALNKRYVESQITHNQQQPGLTPDFKWRVEHPDLFPKAPTYDPLEKSQYQAELNDYTSRTNSLNAALRGAAPGLTPDILAQADTVTPGDQGGIVYRSTTNFPAEIKNQYGEPIKAGMSLTEADAKRLSADDPGSITAEVPAAGQVYNVPYEHVHEWINQSINGPQKPTPPTPIFAGRGGGQGGTQGRAQPANVPEVGTVKQGYKFKGGNPADPQAWEKVG